MLVCSYIATLNLCTCSGRSALASQTRGARRNRRSPRTARQVVVGDGLRRAALPSLWRSWHGRRRHVAAGAGPARAASTSPSFRTGVHNSPRDAWRALIRRQMRQWLGCGDGTLPVHDNTTLRGMREACCAVVGEDISTLAPPSSPPPAAPISLAMVFSVPPGRLRAAERDAGGGPVRLFL